MIKIIKEDLDFGFGEGKCSPAIDDYTEDVDDLIRAYEMAGDIDQKKYYARRLDLVRERLDKLKDEINKFHHYWSKKYYLYKNMIDENVEKIQEFKENHVD